VLPVCGGGVLDGGDTGESLLAAACRAEYSFGVCGMCPVGVGVGKVGWVRLVVMVGTLLGPEGTTVGLLSWWRSAACSHSYVKLFCSGRCGAGWGGGFGGCVVGGVVVGCVFVENCTVDASIFCDLCGQVAEGARWMPWHQEPMKDVGGRDRPGGVVNRAVIPGCPNGGTQHQSCGVTCA
jgi:hypothetical protein